MLAPEPVVRIKLPLVEDLLLSESYINGDDPLTWLRRALIVGPDMIEQVVSETVGQRDNVLWGAVRKMRLTSSNFGPILGAINRNR